MVVIEMRWSIRAPRRIPTGPGCRSIGERTSPPTRSGAAGFSLIELMLVVGMMGVVTSIAVMQIGNSREGARADGAMRTVMAQMNQAREMAITQRRYMRVTFNPTAGEVRVTREDTTTATTVLASVTLEGGVKFIAAAGVPDSPDAFGVTSGSPTPTSFISSGGRFPSTTGTNEVAKFTPEGTLIDAAGRLANGTVFMAVPNVGGSSRVVTVLGSTGRVRGYRLVGQNWKAV